MLLSRRLLPAAGAVLALLLSGCAVDVSVDRDQTPVERVAALTPDARVVVRLVRQVRGDLDQLDRITTSYPRLTKKVAGLRAAEQAHLEALRGAVPKDDEPAAQPTTQPVPKTRQQALQTTIAAAGTWRDTTSKAAAKVESGRFAQLLAAMAAGTGQQLAALGQQPAALTEPATSGSPTSTPAGATTSRQAVLAGEHAAVYVFALLAAQTSQTSQKATYDTLSTTWAWHRDRRDALVAELSAAGAVPRPAAASYRAPADAAVRTEQRVSALYGNLVANTSGTERSRAVGALDHSAQLELGLGGTPRNLPGLD